MFLMHFGQTPARNMQHYVCSYQFCVRSASMQVERCIMSLDNHVGQDCAKKRYSKKNDGDSEDDDGVLIGRLGPAIS